MAKAMTDERLETLIQKLGDALRQRYDICRNPPDDPYIIWASRREIELLYIATFRYCDDPLIVFKDRHLLTDILPPK